MSGFIFYMHDGPNAFRFELSGNLAGAEVRNLEQAWRTASSTIDGKTLAIDVTFLKSADEKGRDLLLRWWRAGARYVANSPQSRELVEWVTGAPYAPEAVGPTFEPRFTSSTFRAAASGLLLALALLFPPTVAAAELKQQTLDAWTQYLDAANAHMQDRAKGNFLWIDEAPDRLRRVRAGEVVVSPMGHTPQAVPSGLIHHWIGAAFIPGAHIDDILAVVRNYDHYTEFYKTSVIDARTLSRKNGVDRFDVVLVDNAMFMKRALDSEYRSYYVQVDGAKWYSVARTTRVQELADERMIPDGEGSGYIWRLCTISRYEERDGGVYLETEAMALSRPIPMTLRWMVDPIVRRVSRASLTTSLEQTRDATGSLVKSTALTASALPAAGRHMDTRNIQRLIFGN